MKLVFNAVLGFLVLGLMACSHVETKNVEPRFPAGRGDVDSVGGADHDPDVAAQDFVCVPRETVPPSVVKNFIVVHMDQPIEHFAQVSWDGDIKRTGYVKVYQQKGDGPRELLMTLDGAKFGKQNAAYSSEIKGYIPNKKEAGWVSLFPGTKKSFFGKTEYAGIYTGAVYIPDYGDMGLQYDEMTCQAR